MIKRNFGMVAVTPLILLGLLLVASGQENADRKTFDAAMKKSDAASLAAVRDFDDVYPDAFSPAEVDIDLPNGGKRTIGIQKQNPSSLSKVKGRYFHAPLLQFVEPEKQHDGYPAFVWDLDTDSSADGTVALYFKMLTSTPDLRMRCRDAVLRDDREAALAGGATPDDVHVMRWPIKHAVIACKNTSTGELLAVAQTDNLRAEGDEFTFMMNFGPEELRKFKRFTASKRLVFVFSYCFKAVTTYGGSVDLKGVRNAKLVASQKLRSEQVEGKEPIFQSEANEAIRHVYLSVQKTMRVTHKDLIPLLDQPNLYQKLFADDGQITFKDLKAGDEQTALMLAAYLKPHLEQLRESYGGEKSDIKIHEDKLGEGNSSGSGAKAGLGLPLPLPIPISLSLGGELSNSSTKTREVLDRIEEATGSKWAYDKATERFRPHSIKKLKFQSGADQVLIDETTTAFLSVGAENRYLEDTPIPITFTTKTVDVGHRSDLGPYAGVPLGAVIPFFGSKLPKGYRWCKGTSEDPKNVFPNADWVPQHLRGSPLPDMRGEILGGARLAQDVGQLWPGYTLDFSVDGSHFTLPEGKKTTETIEGKTATGTIAATDVMKWTRGWGIPYEFRCKSRPKKDESWAGMSIIDSLTSSYLIYSGSVTGSAPVSVKVDKVPRHVMCRWIIRIESALRNR